MGTSIRARGGGGRGSINACAGGPTRVAQHLQNALRLGNEDCIPYRGWRLKIQGPPACMKWDTQAKYISERETVFLVRDIAQSGEGRREAKDTKVCQ